MNIDRHNYEEYFILYMDDELSAQDKTLVEQFAAQHPDLREELDTLLGTRLSVDESIVFDDKQSLLRTESTSTVNGANFEEWSLLYADNELDNAHKKMVEAFAASSPTHQKELELLCSTVSTPEHIVFPGKASLYRKEENQRPVVYFTIRRIAIAASFILAVSTTALLLSKNNNEVVRDNTVADNIEKTAQTEGTVTIKTADSPAPLTTTIEAKTEVEPVVSAKAGTTRINNTEDPGAVIKPQLVSNNLPLPTENPNMVTNDAENKSLTKLESPVNGALTDPKEFNQAIAVTAGNARPLQLRSAAAPELDEPVNAAYSEVSEPGRKNKLRGFFRKVTRTFEKATNIQATDDEDRLLVGSLAIKL